VAYPGVGQNPFIFGGVEVLPWWGPVAAAIGWVVGPFWVAMEVFERKVAE
jgi:hypothetical protein